LFGNDIGDCGANYLAGALMSNEVMIMSLMYAIVLIISIFLTGVKIIGFIREQNRSFRCCKAA
jgi:hypothetical protein